MYSDNEKKIRRFLRDPNAKIWNDTFLRHLWNMEQRLFARQVPFLRKVEVLRHPPQYQCTYLMDWEWEYADPDAGRPYRALLTHRQSGYVGTYFWEIQQIGLSSGSESDTGYRYTHPWEGYMVGTPAELIPNWLPSDFHQAEKIFFDEEPIEFITWKKLVSKDIAYRSYAGDPQWWTIKDEVSNEFYLYPRPSAVWDDIDSDDQDDGTIGVGAIGAWEDANFIFLANNTGGLHTYSVDDSGNLTHIDSDDQGDNAIAVWGDGRFIYLANWAGGLHTYSVDDSGNLTHIDSDDQGDAAYGVWGDGRFVYLANDTGGLHTYSVDDSGNLTHIDSDDQGDRAYGVWGDGSFIYLANNTGGLHTYSVDDSGNLTHIDSDDQGGAAWAVWGDGRFIYLANYGGGLHTYSVDDSGNLTHIDSDDQGYNALGVWGDGRFIFLANDAGGLHTYSVDDSGNLTHIDSDDQGDNAHGVWGDGRFIYLTNYSGGLHTYSVDDSGNLTHIDFDDQGDLARGVWVNDRLIYFANYECDFGMVLHTDFTTEADETGVLIDATGAETTANLGLSSDYLRAADNILMIYKASMSDIGASDDEPGISRHFQKYIEYGVLSRAYRANNDGAIKSLADYWDWRKAIGARVIEQYVLKRLQDRDFRLTSGRRPVRRQRGPRLPSTYPAV